MGLGAADRPVRQRPLITPPVHIAALAFTRCVPLATSPAIAAAAPVVAAAAPALAFAIVAAVRIGGGNQRTRFGGEHLQWV